MTNLGFSNGDPGYFDLDYIVWEGSLPDQSTEAVFQSRDAGFEYLPGPDWWSWGYSNVSYSPVLYYTQSTSAAFRFNFTGESVELFGYLDKNHGNFSCEVDGVSRGVYSGYYPSKLYQQVICFGDNLDDGDHILEVKNIPIDTNDGWFSIDYARVRGSDPYVIRFSTATVNVHSLTQCGYQRSRNEQRQRLQHGVHHRRDSRWARLPRLPRITIRFLLPSPTETPAERHARRTSRLSAYPTSRRTRL